VVRPLCGLRKGRAMSQNGAGYAYRGGPIDWWVGWQRYSDAIAGKYPDGGENPKDDVRLWSRSFELARGQAQVAFARLGWDMNLRYGDLFVTAAPYSHDDSSVFDGIIIAAKQDNNGTTFVWSPFPLPWLLDAGWTEWVPEEPDEPFEILWSEDFINQTDT
jgi:hypothetical protein